MMNSGELQLKDSTTLRTSIKGFEKAQKKINKQKTSINEEKLPKISEPLIYIRQISFLSESIINYFSIGICLFIYGCHGLKWFNANNEKYKNFFIGYFLISGISLYFMGIINWYEGRELIFIIDFIFSFLFIALYLKYQQIFGYISDFSTNNDKLEGIFYILLFCFLLIIGISSKDNGIAFIVNCGTLFVSFVFLFVYKFSKNNKIAQIDYYFFLVSGVLFWVTGIFKLLANLMNYSTIFFELYD